MEYYTYVIFSPQYNQIYIGFTSDIKARFLSHNLLAPKGWTVRFRPWKLVHQESFQTKKEAMTREKQLKSAKGRDWIRKHVLSNYQ